MSIKLDRRAFIGTALTFGALCSLNPAQAFGVTASEKKAEVESIKSKFDAMNDELDAAVDKYDNAQDEYDKATSKITASKSKIAAAQAKIDELQGHLGERAAAMYRTGSMSYLDVLLGVGSFGDFATVWDTLNTLNSDDADLVTKTKAAKADLEAAQQDLATEQAKAKAALDEAKSYKATIEAKTASYKAQYNSLSSEYKKLLEEAENQAAQAATAAASAYTPDTGGATSSSIPANGDVVDYARSRIGCPYVWGATGPSTFDCSGLTSWCYSQTGVSIPRTSSGQYSGAAARLSVYSASAGDVLHRSGHVAIYAGGNSFIHAPHTGDHVRQASGIGSFSSALRF